MGKAHTEWRDWYVDCAVCECTTIWNDIKPDKSRISSSWKAISELRGATEVWCHINLLAARHKRAHPALTPAGEGWYSIYLPRRDGRLSWPKCLITSWPGIESMTARSEVRRTPYRCATETPKLTSVTGKLYSKYKHGSVWAISVSWLGYIWMQISQKRLKIETRFQWDTNRNGIWRIEWSRDRWRHVDLERSICLFKNGCGYRLVYHRASIGNGTWGIKWSRDWWRHSTRKVSVMA